MQLKADLNFFIIASRHVNLFKFHRPLKLLLVLTWPNLNSQ